ncbi:Conserved_hypothetical protein [Hexamita inflata]|uniref:Uncharacterized protein n=1 Tax=Hexamita inflata TaxID=28002 RepID=A0AA86Q0Z2_9EUKA|nr:Conserved hypothetical protein [Hexamita inflata]CAI9944810.1 Conserved hypothetical protein [Hexamita inflata]
MELQKAQQYLSQNHGNISQAIQQLQHEIESNTQEYLSTVQHQVDTAQLITDLLQQAEQLIPELNKLLGDLQRSTSSVIPESQQLLFEQIGFAFNNVTKTNLLYQQLVSVPFKVHKLQQQISETNDLVQIQKELIEIEHTINTIQFDTSNYLQQSHVNKVQLPNQLTQDTEQILMEFQKYFKQFNSFHQILHQHIVCDAPLQLLNQAARGEDYLIKNYQSILLEQENLQPGSLKQLFSEIAGNLCENIHKQFEFDHQKPDFRSLLEQFDVYFQSIQQQIAPVFDIPASAAMINQYKVSKIKNILVSDFIDFRRLFVGAGQRFVKKAIENTIQYTIQQDKFSPQFIQSVLEFSQNYSDLMSKSGLGIDQLQAVHLTNQLQLQSDITLGGIRPYSYVALDQLSQEALGQILGSVSEKLFRAQLKNFWERTSDQDRQLILKQSNMSSDNFFQSCCGLQNTSSELMSKYKEHMCALFHNISVKLYSGYKYLIEEAQKSQTSLASDLFQVVDIQFGILQEPGEISLQIGTILTEELFKALQKFCGSVLNDLKLVQPLSVYKLLGQEFSSYFEDKPFPKWFEKFKALLVKQNPDFRLIKDKDTADVSKIAGQNMSYVGVKAPQYDLRDVKHIDIFTIMSNDAALLIQGLNNFLKQREQFIKVDSVEHQITVQLLNKVMITALAKQAFRTLMLYKDNFKNLYDPIQHVPDFYEQLKQFLVESAQKDIQKIHILGKPKYKTEFCNILYQVEFLSFLLKGKEYKVGESLEEQLNATKQFHYLTQLEKDVQDIGQICTKIGMRDTEIQKRVESIEPFWNQNLKSMKQLSNIMTLAFYAKYKNIKEQDILLSIPWTAPIQDFWALRDLDPLDRIFKEPE